MMRQFLTSTVEQRKTFDSNFETHPMEVAWASEAIFFIQVEKIVSDVLAMKVYSQISVDGVFWIDEGATLDTITKEGRYFLRLKHFGGWLRLRCEMTDNSKANLTIHLVCKE
ncbi:MAG: hypothetical protein WD431_26180 [Cyclobacteriaceae bacterium]